MPSDLCLRRKLGYMPPPSCLLLAPESNFIQMKRSFPSSSSADSNRPFSLNISDLGDPDLAPFTKITLLEVIVYAMDGLQEMYLTILSRLQSGDAATWGITVSTVLFTSTMMYAFLYPAPADSSSGSHDDKEEKEEEEAIVMRDFTIQQLREFNGADNKPIYVALKGDVFDVTSSRHMYGPEGSYHCFAGREASRAMAKLSFEEEELSNLNLSDLSPFEKSSLSDWYEKFRYFKDYPIVGKVSTPPSNLVLTEEELKKVRGLSEVPPGRVDAPIYVAVKGDIFDVSYGGKEMYGEKSTYFIFTGIDASRALAKMSFSPEELNNRNISDLSEGELKILNDWHDKFALKRLYPIVGKLLPVSTVQ